jgi:hypothetical protein
MRFKKLCGFYAGAEDERHSVYVNLYVSMDYATAVHL